jgi:DNA-binding response OmpR family regulator
MKILVIEDEIELQISIQQYLSTEGNLVESATNYKKALQKISDFEYDCILVDITLPFGSGLDLIKEIKAMKSGAGIIIISAKDSFDDKIVGLDLGADDYLSKPFHLPELNARIKALIRRNKFQGENQIVFNEITIVPQERKVMVNGSTLSLTGKEYELLLYLIVNKNKVLTKSALAEHIWGDYVDGLDNLDFLYNHIKNLRKKLMQKNCTDYLQTIYGLGYNFKTSE